MGSLILMLLLLTFHSSQNQCRLLCMARGVLKVGIVFNTVDEIYNFLVNDCLFFHQVLNKLYLKYFSDELRLNVMDLQLVGFTWLMCEWQILGPSVNCFRLLR